MKSNLHFLSALVFSSELQQKVGHCIAENQCYTIWFGPVWESKQLRVLWMYVSNKAKTALSFPPAYTKALYKEHSVLLLLLDEQDLGAHQAIGNTLFKTSITPTRVIYQKDDHAYPRILYQPFDSFIALYQEKQALLTRYCQDFVASKINGSTLAYFKALEYNFEVLELLLLGIKKNEDTFTERLHLLERIIPQMKTLFVKRKNQTYYILEHLDTDDSWIPALEKIQRNLQEIVMDVLEQIDRKTSLTSPKPRTKKKTTNSFKYKEKLLPLLETNQIEEIYQFHETLYCKENKQIRQCYLLALTKKNKSSKLQRIINEVATKDPEVQFTIIAHSRSYIQHHAELFADFFKVILKPKKRLYSSDFYPKIHWQKNYWTTDQDYPALWKKNVQKTNKIIQMDLHHSGSETFISTYQLHQCLAIKLQHYILHHLHYLPQTNHLDTLLQLALYAENKEAQTLNSLYSQLNTLLLVYTSKKKEEKKCNLVLDSSIVDCLQQFFSTIEVSET